MRRAARAMTIAMLAAFALHTVTALWVWGTWGYFGRSNVITWIDFPVSLAYMHLDGSELLTWSLVAGGLQWSAVTALLTFLLGRSLRWRT